MDKQGAKELVEKYNLGLANAEEKAWLENWYAHKSVSLLLSEEEIDFDQVHADLRMRTFKHAGILTVSPQPTKRKLLWPYIAVAASLLLIAGFGVYFYNNYYKPGYDLVHNDVPAGKNSATLTLSNGKKIRLSDAVNGEIGKEAGVKITKTKEGMVIYNLVSTDQVTGGTKFNTLSTAKGEMFQIVLPDHSSVWLNAASSLKYPSSFATLKNREVQLVGEAYFEISKDKAHPFIVQSRNQKVQVLGTHFNVNSYEDEADSKTTLLEGSVKVSSTGNEKQSATIKPGEQAINANNDIHVVKADLRAAVDWKNGDFTFKKGEDFYVAMRKIARWYDVEVIYETPVSDKIDLGGWVSRKNGISNVLDLIQSTGKVHFKIEGRSVTVMK